MNNRVSATPDNPTNFNQLNFFNSAAAFLERVSFQKHFIFQQEVLKISFLFGVTFPNLISKSRNQFPRLHHRILSSSSSSSMFHVELRLISPMTIWSLDDGTMQSWFWWIDGSPTLSRHDMVNAMSPTMLVALLLPIYQKSLSCL